MVEKRVPVENLVTTAFFMVIVFGTILDIIAVQKPNSLVNHLVTVVSLSGYAASVFWPELLLIAFSYFSRFSCFQYASAGFRDSTLAGIWEVIKLLVCCRPCCLPWFWLRCLPPVLTLSFW